MILVVAKAKALYYFTRLCLDPSRTKDSINLQRQVNKLATPKQRKRYGIKVPDNKAPAGKMHVNSLGGKMQIFLGPGMAELTIYKNPDDDFERFTNDMWFGHNVTHVLLDADISAEGEMKTFGFLVAQYPSPMAVLLVAMGVLNTLFNMRDCNTRFRALFDGWASGRIADSIVGVDWNKYWGRPLKEVRALYNIDQPMV